MKLIKFEGDIEIDLDKIKDNPYAILGITKDASNDEIIRAYKMLAARYHPDKYEGEQEYFLLLGVAKITLLDSKKRALYDEYYIFNNKTEGKNYRDALGQIQHIFKAVVQKSQYLDYTDIKESMIQSTKQSIKQQEAEIKKQKQSIEKSKKMLERISGHGKKGDYLVKLIKAQIDVDEKQSIASIGVVKNNILVCEEVLAILDEFECTFESMTKAQETLQQSLSLSGYQWNID